MLLRSLLIIMSFLCSIKILRNHILNGFRTIIWWGLIFSKVYLMERERYSKVSVYTLYTCLSCYTRKERSQKEKIVQMDREILVNNKIHVAQLPMNWNSFFSEQSQVQPPVSVSHSNFHTKFGAGWKIRPHQSLNHTVFK
jgi:hypothetical protein